MVPPFGVTFSAFDSKFLMIVRVISRSKQQKRSFETVLIMSISFSNDRAVSVFSTLSTTGASSPFSIGY